MPLGPLALFPAGGTRSPLPSLVKVRRLESLRYILPYCALYCVGTNVVPERFWITYT